LIGLTFLSYELQTHNFHFHKISVGDKELRKKTPTTKSTITSITMILTTKASSLTATDTIQKVTTALSSSSFTTFQNETLAQTNKSLATHCAPSVMLDSALNYFYTACLDKYKTI
jgi:hypothetical protein